MHGAANNGNTKIAIALIKAGADINAKSKWGWTPLYSATFHGYTKIAFALVKAGANLNIRTNKDKTALQVAIDKHGKDSVIALFLQKAMEKSGKINEEKAEELLRALE